jgi:hypothetical protein
MRSAMQRRRLTTPTGARRTARELLAYIGDHVELPEEIVSKIDAVLRE